jgi:CheY-like chemotaxis protein
VPYTLLLADDSVTIQRVIELTFADEDVDVVAVSDGDQAIEHLESAPPDIVLADIGVPGRNGYEVALYIRQSPALSHIPVILLTGAFEPVDHIRATEAGCDSVLQKPFEPQLLIGRVKELLTNRRQPPPPPEVTPAPLPTHASDLNESGADQPPAPPGAAPGLDDYFERLDAALAGIAGAPTGHSGPTAPQPAESSAPFGSDPAEPGAELPEQSAETPPIRFREALELPSIADAFAALLAAEQSKPLPASAPTWPAIAPSNDALVEKVTRQVLAHMTDRVVRETVADLVSQVAERLVREEIERIKAAIR